MSSEETTDNNVAKQQLNWPTLILILVSGGANFFQTGNDGRLTREEAERVAREIHEMHATDREFGERQMKILEANNAMVKELTGRKELFDKLITGQDRLWRMLQNKGNPTWHEEFHGQ